LAKMRAGAGLVQIYSGLVFAGLGLVGDIKRTLIAALDRDRVANLADYVGADAASVTAEPWPQ
jgi:dihydroorotate dehydrogenase